MSGFGGMVSFELDGSLQDVTSFVSNRRFFTLGESLGGVRSLICHPARMTHASIPADRRAALGLSESLIRLSPGCEDGRDLVDLPHSSHRRTTDPGAADRGGWGRRAGAG